MKKIYLFLIMALFFLSIINNCNADDYSFTRIADSNDFSSINSPGFGSINNSGNVVFWASKPGTSGFYLGSGGSLTTIGQFSSCVGTPTINNSDMVAFTTHDSNGGVIEVWDGNALSSVVHASTSLSNLGGAIINDNATIVFNSHNQTGSYNYEINMIKNGILSNVVVANNSPFVDSFSNISMNNSDEVLFQARRLGETSGLFVKDQLGVKAVVDVSGKIVSVGSMPSINDLGTVAGLAILDAGGEGIFAINDIGVTKIADTSGAFSGFGGGVDINNSGTVSFVAYMKSGGIGIFTGTDLLNDKVIAIGDDLFGSKVKSLSWEAPINDLGQIAFRATLEDGTAGIYRADVNSVVPEPSSLLLIGFGGIITAFIKRRRKA